MWLAVEINGIVVFRSPSFPVRYRHRCLTSLNRLNFTHQRWVEIWGHSLTDWCCKTKVYAIRMHVIQIGQGSSVAPRAWQVVLRGLVGSGERHWCMGLALSTADPSHWIPSSTWMAFFASLLCLMLPIRHHGPCRCRTARHRGRKWVSGPLIVPSHVERTLQVRGDRSLALRRS